jgi:hypothetical protein
MTDVNADIRIRVSDALPAANADSSNLGIYPRGSKYGEQLTISLMRKQQALVNEGSYLTACNAQTGIAMPAAATWVATTPAAVVVNSNEVGGKSIYLDYLNLVCTAAGGWASAGVNVQLMVYLDTINRYSSGGTNLSALFVNPNTAKTNATGALFYFGAVTATAASAARAICGLRILRPAVSTTVAHVVGEQILLNFGGVEGMLNGSITIANANNIPMSLPAVQISPGSSALIYYVMNGTTPSASSFAPELGIIER